MRENHALGIQLKGPRKQAPERKGQLKNTAFRDQFVGNETTMLVNEYSDQAFCRLSTDLQLEEIMQILRERIDFMAQDSLVQGREKQGTGGRNRARQLFMVAQRLP